MFNPYTLNHHCTDCDDPLYNPHDVLKDHLLCVWQHYGYIAYPEILATDAKGKTLEGVVAVPAQNLITRIPISSGSWCLDCMPLWKESGCGICGRRVDTLDPYSRVETIKKYTSGLNLDYKVYMFHQECLDRELFAEIHEYQAKYRPQQL